MTAIVPDIIPLVQEADASPEVQKIYEGIKEGMRSPSVPNFAAALGHSAPSLNVVLSMLTQLLNVGTIEPPVKMMCILAVAASRDCRYCEASHMVLCKLAGIEQSTLDKIAEDAERSGLEPPKLRTMIQFCVKAALTPQEMTPADYEGLFEQGLSKESAVELVSMAAYALYAITLTDALAVPLDEAFESMLG